jgi:hypothetical protein
MRTSSENQSNYDAISGEVKKKVKISLLQAMEDPRGARGRGSHIT